jgi:hypothetical protein
MKLRSASTGMFSVVLALSLIFTFLSPASALELPAGHDTSGSLGNGSIDYVQDTTNLTSGMGQQTGAPGSHVTIRGNGFRAFTPVESIEIGGIDVLGNRTVNTDENGAFEATDLVVPDLDPGIYSLRIQVGTGDLETTAVSTFEVTAPSETTGPGAAAAQALEPLGARLERAFHFDNATKNWSFYDPRPEFTSANTIRELTEGQIYWIKVTQNTTAVLNGQERVLTCVNEGTPQEDCWNLVVW